MLEWVLGWSLICGADGKLRVEGMAVGLDGLGVNAWEAQRLVLEGIIPAMSASNACWGILPP